MANVSYRLGKQSPPEAIRRRSTGNGELADAFERCREYLRENSVDLDATPAVLGPWVTFDAKQERFVHEFADDANKLSRARLPQAVRGAESHVTLMADDAGRAIRVQAPTISANVG